MQKSKPVHVESHPAFGGSNLLLVESNYALVGSNPRVTKSTAHFPTFSRALARFPTYSIFPHFSTLVHIFPHFMITFPATGLLFLAISYFVYCQQQSSALFRIRKLIGVGTYLGQALEQMQLDLAGSADREAAISAALHAKMRENEDLARAVEQMQVHLAQSAEREAAISADLHTNGLRA